MEPVKKPDAMFLDDDDIVETIAEAAKALGLSGEHAAPDDQKG